jgi:hypothetical protein
MLLPWEPPWEVLENTLVGKSKKGKARKNRNRELISSQSSELPK